VALGPDATLAASALRGERELEWTLAGSVVAEDAESSARARIREAHTPPSPVKAGPDGAVLFRCVSPPLGA
jgi:hypothetical protein